METAMITVHDFTATAIDGGEVALSEFRGRVLLIVNVASRCGFTPQYRGLEAMYRSLREAGLTVLGFPCNQFGQQEPGSNEEIAGACNLDWDVSFPMFAKIDVNGEHAHPLYRHLKQAAPGVLGTESVKWNFTKFLVGRDGRVLRRFAPNVSPDSIQADVVAALG
jgi:glutathione peroxidase